MRFEISAALAGTLLATMVAAAPMPAPELDLRTDGNDFITVALDHHNMHRANHSVVDLTYDDTLGNYAATVASSCKFEHDTSEGGGGYGQNIAAATGFTSTADALADAITGLWYNGEAEAFADLYGEANPDMSNFDSWGHFTQLIWGGSTTVGCSVQYCAAGTIYSSMASWFTVCNYGDAGNMGGEYAANINRPKGEATASSRI